MDVDIERSLKIKTNVLKRCMTEYKMYLQEVNQNESILRSMEKSHDKYKQLSQVLEESKSMVSDTMQRMEIAKEDLEKFAEDNEIKLMEEADRVEGNKENNEVLFNGQKVFVEVSKLIHKN